MSLYLRHVVVFVEEEPPEPYIIEFGDKGSCRRAGKFRGSGKSNGNELPG